nr:glutathione transferase (EC 2.5.1.18) class mu 10 - pig (fragments) [Sus scrofa domesticus]
DDILGYDNSQWLSEKFALG